MGKAFVLYNNKAGFHEDVENLKLLEFVLDDELEMVDIRRLKNYRAFLSGLEQDDYIVLAGGDGTLNHFVNDTADIPIPCEVLYYPNGTGNDFAKEMGYSKGCHPFPIDQYIKHLPTVTVKGKTYRFLNGIGYGIDGYCCEMGDELRKTATRPINYTSIAIKGLLLHYTPTNATVTVDGVRHSYKKVWLAPTMYGRFYGGGMAPTPDQKRTPGAPLSVMVCHGAGRLKTLVVFPSIFQGTHVSHTEMIEVLTGREITVEFDSPRALQIDGETVLNVSSYTARSFEETPC